MEIEKGNTIGGQRFIEFRDDINTPCGVQLGESPKLRKHLKFSVNADFAIFTQEQIKTLLPYLQSFAETGELEPQQSTLQGGIEQLTRELLKASKLVENGFVSDEEVEAYSDACTHFIREARKLLGE